MHEEASNKAIVAALVVNLAIAVAKLIGFLFTGAASMLAESIHSLADTGNQGLLLLGGKLSKRRPNPEHPFGYGRETFFWAFVVSMVLFSLGSLFALYEGIEKVLKPHELDSPKWAIVILLVAVVLEGFSFRTAIHEARPLKGELSWPQFIRRTKRPELATVLLEDLGALIGLVLALLGVGLASITGEARFDAVGSIAIGLLLGFIAMILARENKSLLIGEAADENDVKTIHAIIVESTFSHHLINMRTLQLSSSELLVAAKIDFGDLNAKALGGAIDHIEAQIRQAVPAATQIFIEPSTYDPNLAGDSEDVSR